MRICYGINATFFASAAVFEKIGTIKVLSITDSVLTYDPALSVIGFTSAGNCYIDSSGHVLIMMKIDEKGKAQFSLALAAYMSGKKIKVKVDDTNKHSSGICYMYWVGFDSAID